MKNLILLVVLFLMNAVASAQVAIIQDKDGYTNVREKPNGQSNIIHRINNNEAFWYINDERKSDEEWVLVYIPKNPYSLGSTQSDYIEGYIHTSRLKPLEKLQPYKGEDFSFKYLLEPFALNNRIVDRYNGAVTAIAGRPVWGTDGDFPKTQVKDLLVTIEGNKLDISKAFYCDLFECTNTFNVYKSGDCYVVYQWNSDGAGAYQVVWVFTKNGLKQRLVGSMI
ncbi:SH3 domain-containing protein [Rufibacter roseus]|uniref:SH3 domain-containing protein n=1 Tax=Rufibacter roseus TaxID=1567108 RepID=A0ABW2DTH1_9BACT|nr:SH3 domain-containing protein [Rufibacter roseus]